MEEKQGSVFESSISRTFRCFDGESLESFNTILKSWTYLFSLNFLLCTRLAIIIQYFQVIWIGTSEASTLTYN